MAPPLPQLYAQGQGAVAADGLNTFVQTVVNYAQLRTFTGLSNMVVQVQGATAPADGGQGVYYYSASSTAADNNSTVIVPTGAVQGAWLQIPAGTITNLVVSGTLTVDGATTLQSTLGVTGVATFAADVLMTGTGEVQLPVGTTAQRSGAPELGMIRYNNSLNYFEGYGPGGWAPLAGSTTSGIFPGDIFGLLPSGITGSSTSAALTVSTGKAVDSTAVNILNLAIAASWSVANGNAINGYQGGTTLPNSATIHFFVCSGTTGTGVFASLSLTPTLPAGYTTYYRRIFSLPTTSGGALVPVIADEVNGGGLCAYLTTMAVDINNATATTASRTLYSMTVPSGIKVQWLGVMQTPSASTSLIMTSPDETDIAPGTTFTTAPTDVYFTSANTDTPATRRLTITNTGGQIGVRGSATGAIYAITSGWIDFRRT